MHALYHLSHIAPRCSTTRGCESHIAPHHSTLLHITPHCSTLLGLIPCTVFRSSKKAFLELSQKFHWNFCWKDAGLYICLSLEKSLSGTEIMARRVSSWCMHQLILQVRVFCWCILKLRNTRWRVGWRNMQITLIFARIISFMLFIVLLLLMHFILKNFWFKIHIDSWFLTKSVGLVAFFCWIPYLQAHTHGWTDGRTDWQINPGWAG